MRKIEIDERKRIQLEILKDVHDFCVENGISYFLGYGTLLGAIRHNGYIPWDDDIDIFMPRPDYLKFSSMYNTRKSDFRFICKDNCKGYMLPFGKVHHSGTELREMLYCESCYGIYIDVFPIDGCDKAGKSLRTAMKLRKLLHTKMAVLGPHRSFIKNLIIALGKITLIATPYHIIQNQFESLGVRNAFVNSEDAACLMDPENKMPFPKEWVLSVEDHIFEGEMFKIPKHYDKLLRYMYGDYMTPPPEGMRASTHTQNAWWKD